VTRQVFLLSCINFVDAVVWYAQEEFSVPLRLCSLRGYSLLVFVLGSPLSEQNRVFPSRSYLSIDHELVILGLVL
jgi:hypothetical protein